MMIKLAIFRFRGRRAVSTIIGGMIILSLLLTALGTMIFVSQQYDQYQTTASKMSQYHIQQLSENIVANFPGLQGPTSVTGCGGNCNLYNMTISNLSGIGIQIARVYINSTSGGCVSLCVLNPNPTAQSYTFRQSDRFLNTGEINHAVLLWLPNSVTLPNPNPPTPQNTIYIVTTRGRVFPFQWPYPPLGTALGGQTGAAVSTGIMKIAYQGFYDSKNDYYGAVGNTSPSAPYCHNEQSQSYPALPGYAETLTDSGLPGGSLTFVNPWIIDQILGGSSGVSSGSTTLYVYANAINTRNSAITVTTGAVNLVIAQSTANNKAFFLGGSLLGIYYSNKFYAAGTSPSIPATASFYGIYKITQYNLGPPAIQGPAFFLGNADLSNNAKDQTYFSGEILLDGLYDRGTC